jgi:isoquinoline 1-oxidoreductase subunit beta
MVRKRAPDHRSLFRVRWELSVMIHDRPQWFDHARFRTGNMSRAVVGGSMVLTLRLPSSKSSTGIAQSSASDASIRIDCDGKVFLTVPHLGGSQASIGLLIANQLEVALNKVHLEHALPKKEFAVHEKAVTGNSEGVRAALKRLCEGAATARAMLIAAAAERWSVDFRSCHALKGEVIHTVTRRKLGYGELIIDAAYRPIPVEVELKQLRAADMGYCL